MLLLSRRLLLLQHAAAATPALLFGARSSAAAYSSSYSVASSSTTEYCIPDIMDSHPIGLGTMGLDRSVASSAIQTALELGYSRIDCAPVYFNEDAVGDALHSALTKGIVERKDLFVVSKLASPFHRKEHVELALRKSLADLRLDYLDLYLVHWPVAFQVVPNCLDPNVRGYKDEEIDNSEDGKRIDPTVSIHETWEAMEDMVEKGLVRHIGVSNFPVSLLHELLTQTKRIPPAVNQCESHPYLPQTKLVKYCQMRGIHFQAYSPLGSPGYKEANEPTILNDPVLGEVAARHNATAAQVCLAWALQRGTSVVVKSGSAAHLKDNWQVLGARQHKREGASTTVLLTKQDMEQIDALDRNYRFFRPEDWWPEYPVPVFD